MKVRTTKGFKGLLKAKALWGLVFALVFTSVALAAGYRCTPCSQNYYCKAGVSYECPDATPVTIGTGAKSASECMTCADRDGESYPFYDEISGDCMACWQVPETTTPYWDGTTCTACPDGKTWDSEGLKCVESGPACVFTIEGICLVESAPSAYTELGTDVRKNVNEIYTSSDTYFGYISNADADAAFLAKYGIATSHYDEQDYWAGAMKYCQDKGLRLPTTDELHTIMNVVYGTNNTCANNCTNINSETVGGGCCYYNGLRISNKKLWGFLQTGTPHETISPDSFILWSSAEFGDYGAFSRFFYTTNSDCVFDNGPRSSSAIRALCVK